ncbi:MAG: hypothetical protein BRC58_10995 [Cyanobacteria bacterium QS_8_64_29]|nr:MAG: hypothetical protein BRC58_10995 [Cyanobacteria bacterium QS_8_64_29]
MLWLLFAALTAVCGSLRDLASKRGLQDLDAYVVTWASRAFALPVLLPALLVDELPELGDHFGLVLAAALGIQVVANLLYFRALQQSDLSLTVPIVSFTPLFLFATAPLIVGERLSSWDALGMASIVSGSYALSLSRRQQGVLAPFRALFRQRGPQLMLGVAFCWSLLSTLNKVGVRNSSPAFWAATTSVMLVAALSPIVLARSRAPLAQLARHLPIAIATGLLQGLTVLFLMQALQLTLVAHVVAVKRTSILISALLGHLLLAEPGLRERGTGAAIMVAGVAIVTLL